jgi:2-hydroxychromene-2-carboxylate isomerase
MAAMPSAALDFWFDFASTYSYLAAERIGPLAEQAKVTVRFRPFLLGPIFKVQGFATSPFNIYPAKGRHMWRDLERLSAEYGLPFRRPEPFPQNSLLAARVALVGLRGGWGMDFCRAVFRAEFADGRRIDELATIRDLLTELRIDAEPALAAAQSDEIKTQLRTQTEAAERADIFGAPAFTTVDGELFWGNDRLEQALRWAKQSAR